MIVDSFNSTKVWMKWKKWQNNLWRETVPPRKLFKGYFKWCSVRLSISLLSWMMGLRLVRQFVSEFNYFLIMRVVEVIIVVVVVQQPLPVPVSRQVQLVLLPVPPRVLLRKQTMLWLFLLVTLSLFQQRPPRQWPHLLLFPVRLMMLHPPQLQRSPYQQNEQPVLLLWSEAFKKLFVTVYYPRIHHIHNNINNNSAKREIVTNNNILLPPRKRRNKRQHRTNQLT